MPGTFSKQNRPRRPGSYVNFEAIAQANITSGVGSIVAIPFTHDWGPFKVPVLVGSLSEFQSVFGPSKTTPGYIAVEQAFLGEGLPGRGGAGAVLCYRTGGASAAKAIKTLQNTTPTNALTLTAKYEGAYGNGLSVTTQDYAADPLQNELIVYLNSVEIERYHYLDTNIADLVTQINANSKWITATQLVTGVALATIASSPFAGGDSGTTITSGDWANVWSALEVERFGILAPFDLTAGADLTALKTWAQNINAAGKRFTVVVGGTLNEIVSAAVTRSASLNDENFINVGNGSVRDANLLDAAGVPMVLSTSQLAPRIAGILAQKGEAKSLTFSRLQGLTLLNGPTDANVLSAFDGGVIVLTRDSNVDSPVRIEKGLTTYTTTTNAQKPYSIYRNPKFVRTMQAIQMDFQDWAESKVIGLLPVNNKTRDFAIGEMRRMVQARQDVDVVQPGWTVAVDPDPPPSDNDEFIALVVGVRFGRSVEQVFFTIRVG